MKRLVWFGVLVSLACPTAWSQPIRPTVGEVKIHEAQAGEDLLDIASRYGLAIDHLCFANNWPTEATDIYEGTEVTVPGLRILPDHPPRTGIVINLPERILYHFEDGQLKATYPCSIGHPKLSPTPSMKCRVSEKVVDPVWYPPSWAGNTKPVGPGPNNPLGDRWIGLSAGRYGIHSTYTPVNVGNDVTHGCVRMYPDSIRKLYPSVQVGWPVIIEYEVAKLGRTSGGETVLETFPDTYKRQRPEIVAKRLVEQNGFIWSEEVAKQAKLVRGLPIVLKLAKDKNK